jgi:phosphohistidine phosphatase SixA
MRFIAFVRGAWRAFTKTSCEVGGIFFIFAPTFALAQGTSDAALGALKTGGHILIMRHAQTVPGVGDPEGFKLGDCKTQRNLSEAGRAQAKALAETLKKSGNIKFDSVYSSAWCRCLETGKLAFGVEPKLLPALNSTFNDRSQQPSRTAELRNFIRNIKSAGNIALVTHQVVISALTNEFTGMGDVLVLKPDANDAAGFKLIGKLTQ